MKALADILLLIFLLNSSPTIGQLNNELTFKNFTINEGLSQNSVIDIAEDNTGFMWFATQDGLNRFDGTNFMIFPVAFEDLTSPDNTKLGQIFISGMELWYIKKGGKIAVLDLYTHNIQDIRSIGGEPLPLASYFFIDSSGNKWLGTYNKGALCFNSKNSLQHFSRSSLVPFKIMDDHVNMIFEDQGGFIWILTEEGITRVGGGASEDFLKDKNAYVVTQANDSSLWVGTLGDGLFFKKPGSPEFEHFPGFSGQKLPERLVIHSIHADKSNRIWVGTFGNGLYVINAINPSVTHLVPDRQNPFSIGFQDVISIKEDSNGGIWIGTDGGGVSYYNRLFNNFKSKRIENVDAEVSIEQLRAIVTDDEGVVWMGTSGQGLTSFDRINNRFETLHLQPFREGISNYDRIVSLEIDQDGDLWIGTQGNGLLVMDRKSKKIKKWFTTEASSQHEKIPGNTIWKIFPYDDRRMWLGNGGAGMVLLDKEEGVVKQFTLPKGSAGEEIAGNVQIFSNINDSLIAVGFEERGVRILNSRTGHFTPLRNNLINGTFRGETGVKSLYYDNGWLWIGTAGKGILVTNIRTGKTYLLSDKNVLPNNMIYSIIPEKEGTVWVSSNKGIFRIDYIHNAEKFAVKQILPFTVADGLQSNEFNTGAYHKASDGTIYLGGIRGITYFDPKEIETNLEIPPIVLTGAKLGNQEYKGDTVITYKNRLLLPHRQNSISFNYTVLDYVSPENMHFQYILQGYEENWVNAQNRNYTAYTNLTPDNYIFKVKGSGKSAMAAPLASILIDIATPFWMSLWFIVLVVGLMALLVYALHLYRINQVLQVQKVKNLISADLHDDLGARLTNIQFLSAIFRHKFPPKSEHSRILGGIEEEVEASAKALDEIVWNIKMNDENLEEVVAKMKSYAGEVLVNDYQYQINVEAEFSRKKMSMQKRREIFLVFKELLNNIRKHARATRVKIKISMKEGMFYMVVKDDGKGFNPTQETSRNGISNIKERVKKWKGNIKFESQEGKGTLVKLKIPFD